MLYGALIGDIVGSKYEFDNIKTQKFKFFDFDMFFTDDTVMSVAIYQALKNTYLNDYKNLEQEVVKQMKLYGKEYPYCSYGNRFYSWLMSDDSKPYNSYGNGSAMRVSAVAYFSNNIEEVKRLSTIVTSVTHNHPEGIKGAMATAICIFMALNGSDKQEIKKYINENYYNLDFRLDQIRDTYFFNETCQETVPQAIVAFLESENFEDCIRKGISIGGDSDTLCAIAGSIAEAYYGIEKKLKNKALSYLDKHLKQIVLDSENMEKKLKEKSNIKR